MSDFSLIKEYAVVLDSSGRQVGVVDHVEGGMIKLIRGDTAAHGQHHFVSLAHVDSISDVVRLLVPFPSTTRH